MYFFRKYGWTIHLAAIVVCAYFLARAITTYLAGALESVPSTAEAVVSKEASEEKEMEGGEASVDDFKAILDRNVFNSADSGVASSEGPESMAEQVGEMGPAVKTGLSIKVTSTLVIGEGTDRRSSAIIAGGASSKTDKAYFPGDEETFAPNTKLVKVAKDRIEFVNNGRLEYAELEDFAAKKSVFAPPDEVHGIGKGPLKEGSKESAPESAPKTAGKIVIDQKDVDEALQNLDKLATEVRIIPNFQEGKPSGMKVLSIKPGGFASKLGIRRGDILSKINGEELDIKRGTELFTSLKDLKNFTLDVTRGGKNQTLEYEIR